MLYAFRIVFLFHTLKIYGGRRIYHYNKDDFNFDLYQVFKQHGYTKTWKQREVIIVKSFSFITYKIVI